MISLLNGGCTCRYGCYCTFGTLQEDSFEPEDLFRKALWATVFKKDIDLTPLYLEAVTQLKPLQKRGLCNTFATEDIDRTPQALLGVLAAVDRTEGINPALAVLLWLSYISSIKLPPTGEILSGDFELPDLKTVELTVPPPQSWPEKLNNIIKKNTMTDEQKGKHSKEVAEKKAAEDAAHDEQFRTQAATLEEAERILEQCKLQSAQISETCEETTISDLIEEIRKDCESFRGKISDVKDRDRQKPQMDTIRAGFTEVIDKLQDQLEHTIMMNAALKEFRDLFTELRKGKLDPHILKAVQGEILQFIIFGRKIVPGSQNTDPGDVLTCSLDDAIENTKTLLTKLLFDEKSDESDDVWVKMFILDCLQPCTSLFEAENRALSVSKLFLNELGAMVGIGLECAFCWHCGNCLGEIPDEMPVKKREVKSLKFKCRVKLLEHLVEIGSIDRHEGSEVYNSVERVSRIIVPCLLMMGS